jgi:hypothetical protein
MKNSTLSLSKRTKHFVALGFLCLILSNAIPHDAIGWEITRISLTIFFLVFAGLAYFSKEENKTAKGYWLIAIMFVIALMALLYPVLFFSLFKK